MNNLVKNRWQVRLAAAIIFILGFTAGILALNVYRARARNADRFEQLSERLQLECRSKDKGAADSCRLERAIESSTSGIRAEGERDSPSSRWPITDCTDAGAVATVSEHSRRDASQARARWSTRR